jgi:fatty acid desaturase
MSLPARTVAPPKRAIDEAIRAIPIDWFKASPAIYWVDMLVGAALGWAALAAGATSTGWARAGWLTVAVFALYHAVLFIHEITHRAQRDVPGFKFAWNVVVGVPLLVPSFTYEGVHTDHHRQRCYGTDADPEYVPFGRRSPLSIAVYVAGSFLAPVIFSVRFAILAPLGWLIPPLGRLVTDRLSSLVINHRYVRHAHIGVAGRAQEAGAFVVCWTAAFLWWKGVLPTSAIWCYAFVSAAASAINSARTLAAHRYDNDHDELSMNEQLLDSCTISPSTLPGRLAAHGGNAFRTLIAPVGLRYHALHHWIPSLPYHNLGRAHRLLVTALTPDAPYAKTIERGFTPVLRDLLHRSSSSSSRS